jgi:hypothetical protein
MFWSSFDKSIRFCLFALLAFTTMALTATAQVLPVGPAVTVFSPPQNISNDPGTSWVHQVAVDSKGNINVVWWDDSPGFRTVFFSRSIDGGLTFSTPQSLQAIPVAQLHQTLRWIPSAMFTLSGQDGVRMADS